MQCAFTQQLLDQDTMGLVGDFHTAAWPQERHLACSSCPSEFSSQDFAQAYSYPTTREESGCVWPVVSAAYITHFMDGPHFWWGGPPTYWSATTRTHHPYHPP